MNDKNKEESLTLEILETIDQSSEITQRHLADRLGVALGLANSYLKRCVRKGLVKIQTAPANRYFYYLTPRGFAEKSRLTARYLSISLEFYRRAGDAFNDIYTTLQEKNLRRIILCGYSELAEIAVLRAHEFDVELLGIFDARLEAKKILGLPVWHQYESLPYHDAFILTTLDKPDQLLKELIELTDNSEDILIPSVLGFSNDKSEEISRMEEL